MQLAPRANIHTWLTQIPGNLSPPVLMNTIPGIRPCRPACAGKTKNSLKQLNSSSQHRKAHLLADVTTLAVQYGGIKIQPGFNITLINEGFFAIKEIILMGCWSKCYPRSRLVAG